MSSQGSTRRKSSPTQDNLDQAQPESRQSIGNWGKSSPSPQRQRSSSIEKSRKRFSKEQSQERQTMSRERSDRKVQEKDTFREENSSRKYDRGNKRSGSNDSATNNQGSSLYVANLSKRVKDSDLRDLFERYGTIQKCTVVVDPITSESRGFAFVVYDNPQDAEDSLSKLNGYDLLGKEIRVEKSKRLKPREATPGRYMGKSKPQDRDGPSRSGRRFDRDDDRVGGDSRRRRDQRSFSPVGKYEDRGNGRSDAKSRRFSRDRSHSRDKTRRGDRDFNNKRRSRTRSPFESTRRNGDHENTRVRDFPFRAADRRNNDRDRSDFNSYRRNAGDTGGKESSFNSNSRENNFSNRNNKHEGGSKRFDDRQVGRSSYGRDNGGDRKRESSNNGW
eukprot:403343546